MQSSLSPSPSILSQINNILAITNKKPVDVDLLKKHLKDFSYEKCVSSENNIQVKQALRAIADLILHFVNTFSQYLDCDFFVLFTSRFLFIVSKLCNNFNISSSGNSPLVPMKTQFSSNEKDEKHCRMDSINICIKVITRSLDTLHKKDIEIFRLCTFEIATILEESCKIWNIMVSPLRTKYPSPQVRLTVLPSSCELVSLSASILDLSSFSSISPFQSAVSEILLHLVREYSQFICGDNPKLFEILCEILCKSDKNGKKSSLKILNHLLSNSSIALRNTNYLTLVVSSILKFGSLHQRFPEFRDCEFDDELGRCMTLLLSSEKFLSESCSNERKLYFIDTIIQQLHWNIENSKSKSFKQSYCEAIKRIITVTCAYNTDYMRKMATIIPTLKDEDISYIVVELIREILRYFVSSGMKKRIMSDSYDEDDEDEYAIDESESENEDNDIINVNEIENPERSEKKRKTTRGTVRDVRNPNFSLTPLAEENEQFMQNLKHFFGPKFHYKLIDQASMEQVFFGELMKNVKQFVSNFPTEFDVVKEEKLRETVHLTCCYLKLFQGFSVPVVHDLFNCFTTIINSHMEDKIKNFGDIAHLIFSNFLKDFKNFSKLESHVLEVIYRFTLCMCEGYKRKSIPDSDKIHEKQNSNSLDLRIQYFPILASFPKTFQLEERRSFFISIIKSPDPKIRAAALSVITIFFRHGGSKYFEDFAPIIRNLHKDLSTDVLCEFCNIFGEIIKFEEPFNMENWQHMCQMITASYPLNVRVSFITKCLPPIVHICSTSDMKNFKVLFHSCISLAIDPQPQVRIQFSRVIGHFVSRNDGELIRIIYNSENEMPLFDKLKEYHKTDDPEIIKTLLMTIGTVGCYAKKDLLGNVLFFLIEYLCHKKLDFSSTAYDQIRHISETRQTETSQLFNDYRERLFNFWVFKNLNRLVLINDFASAVMDTTRSEFLKEAFKYSLPTLIRQKNLNLLKQLASCIGCDHSSLILLNIETTLSELILEISDCSEFKKCIEFVCDTLPIPTKDLLETTTNNLLTDLFIELGVSKNRTRTERALQTLTEVKSTYENISITLQSLISNKFLSIIEHITERLKKQNLEEKQCALHSLNYLLIFAGKDVRQYMPKIMSSIKDALIDPELRIIGYDCWFTFIQQLNAEAKSIFSQIFVDLIPYLESSKSDEETNKIIQIFEWLVVTEKEMFKDCFDQILFLPDMPVLDNVRSSLEQVIGNLSLAAKLDKFTNALQHKSKNVKKFALTQLKSILLLNQNEIISLIMTDTVDNLISGIVSTLLHICSENDELRVLCGECLGAIKAIEPSRFDIEIQRDAGKQMNDIELACVLIRDYLYKHFIATSELYSKAAYAIQELLKICIKFSGGKVDTSDTTLSTEQIKKFSWATEHFSDEILDHICAYTDSRYIITTRNLKEIKIPIYKTNIDFKKWLKQWIYFLMDRQFFVRSIILRCVRSVIRYDISTAKFVLPYLVENVARHGTDLNRGEIKDEIITVLSHESNKQNSLFGSQSRLSEHTQMIFELIDLLNRWHERDMVQASASTPKSNKLKKSAELNACDNLGKLLSEIPKDLLAKAAVTNNAYARALMYYETYIRENSSHNRLTKQDALYLQQIYGCLDDTDGMAGVAANRETTTLQEQVLDHEINGNWTEALNCYEILLQREPDNIQHHHNVLKCYRNLGHLQLMNKTMGGTISRRQMDKAQLAPYGVQAAWRLGEWEMMEEYLGTCSECEDFDYDFELGLARCLSAYRNQDKIKFFEELQNTRYRCVMLPLSAASIDSYQRSFPYIVRLQMLSELEQSYALFENCSETHHPTQTIFNKSEFLKSLDTSFQMIRNVIIIRDFEPLLSLRRIIFNVHHLENELGKCWLYWAKLARKVGHFQTASSAILQASIHPPANLAIEYAKLLWQKGDQIDAIKVAKAKSSQNNQQINGEPLPSFIKVKLLLMAVNWSETLRQEQHEKIIKDYIQVIKEEDQWEEGYYHLAHYLDAILECKLEVLNQKILKLETSSFGGHHRSKQTSAIESHYNEKIHIMKEYVDVIKNYGSSLEYGDKHLYHSLPRMLTLYFNAGTTFEKDFGTKKSKNLTQLISQTMNELNHCISEYISRLPMYQWYTAFSQLVSRIVHPNPTVLATVKKIIATILKTFPLQSIWRFAVVYNSLVDSRKDQAADVLKITSKMDSIVKDYIQEAKNLFKCLIDLANYIPSKNAKTFNCSRLSILKTLKRQFPLKSIVPQQNSLNICMLPQRSEKTGNLPTDHYPFAKDSATIQGFEDEVVVMSSLMKPKKITMLGSDGNKYIFLCKPKDDLRKDARMMEFFTMLNRLLKKDPESRKRNLYIRTFGVIPLSDEGGLIQWVEGTEIYRSVFTDLYARVPDTLKNEVLRQLFEKNPNRIENFSDKILPRFPPVFYKWFLQRFPEPTRWYRSRLNYSRTLAVMSMVGYVAGLGDRHGENILLDRNNGDCIHIDFSCLFERGLSLEVPEVVPFRLTHNMVDALGVTGYKGTYHKSCEVAMNVLRTNKETLMSVLDTFVHDPLVEWTKIKQSGSTSSISKDPGIENKNAAEHLEKIKKKLNGQLDSHIPLSVQGQVNALILQATSPNNLGRMFIWWMPWM